MCVCMKERESVSVCMKERESVCVCVCACEMHDLQIVLMSKFVFLF